MHRTKTVYEAIAANPVSPTADLEEQHRWWRLHDAAKREYAIADWGWESLVLRVLILLLAVVGIASVFMVWLLPADVILAAAALWQIYRILTRSAPS